VAGGRCLLLIGAEEGEEGWIVDAHHRLRCQRRQRGWSGVGNHSCALCHGPLHQQRRRRRPPLVPPTHVGGGVCVTPQVSL
jgi:hypothetical protein